MTFDLDAILDDLAARLAARLEQLPDDAHTSSASEPWRLLNVEEVATMLGRSRRWVHGAVKERGLPYCRLDGGALAFDPADVRAWARERRVPAVDDDPLASRWQAARKAAPEASSDNGVRTLLHRAAKTERGQA